MWVIFLKTVFKKEKGKLESIWESMRASHSLLGPAAKPVNILLHTKYTQALLTTQSLVQISSGAPGTSGRGGRMQRGL